MVFKYESKAFDFYVRGLDQWYLWWGNAVYTYDQAWTVRLLGPLSRGLEQLGGIWQGVHPHLRVLEEVSNRADLEALQRLRGRLFVALGIGSVAVALALGATAGWARERRERQLHAA
jgi:hypothetical protein